MGLSMKGVSVLNAPKREMELSLDFTTVLLVKTWL